MCKQTKLGKQMTVGIYKSCWCAQLSLSTRLPMQSTVVQLERGVPGNGPAPFGAGERLQSPTYRYSVKNYTVVPLVWADRFFAPYEAYNATRL